MLDQNDLERLNAYLDGALNDAERRELEARLQADAALRRELERLRAVRQLVMDLPPLTAPRDFRLPRIMARRRRSFVTSAAFSAMSAAAAVILLVVGGVLFARVGQPMDDMSAAVSEVANAPTMPLALEPEAQIGTLSDATGDDQDLLEYELAETVPGEVARAAANDTAQPSLSPAAPLPQSTMMMQFAAMPTPTPAALAGDENDFGAADMAVPESAAVEHEAPAPLVSATGTLTATATTTPAVTPTEPPTAVPTAAPTLVPLVAESPDNSGLVGVGLITAAVILFGVALVTTLLRRRG